MSRVINHLEQAVAQRSGKYSRVVGQEENQEVKSSSVLLRISFGLMIMIGVCSLWISSKTYSQLAFRDNEASELFKLIGEQKTAMSAMQDVIHELKTQQAELIDSSKQWVRTDRLLAKSQKNVSQLLIDQELLRGEIEDLQISQRELKAQSRQHDSELKDLKSQDAASVR